MKVYGQLFRAQLENKNGDHSSVTGMIWLNTSTSLFKFYDGAAVRTVVTLDNTQTLTNKTLTSPTINTGTLTTPSVDIPLFSHQSAPSSPSAGFVKLYFKSDDVLCYKNSAGTEATVATTAVAAPDQSYEISNLTISLSVATGALTIALKGKDGNDPSGSNIIAAGFRSATATSGVYLRRTVTSALSLVVPSGATLGFVDGVTSYAYIYLIDNAGTVELGVSGIVLDEGTVQTSTTIGTGSDSISGFYSTTGRTSKAIRLIGRVKFSLTTAGTWDETGDELSLIPFTNQLVAALYESNSATSITNNSATIVNFEDKIYDTHNAVTVGASWSYTARVAGVYSVKSFVELASNTGWEAAETAELQLFKNGSIYRALGTKTMETNNPGGYVMSLWGSSSLSLAVGDTVDIRVLQNSDGAINTSTSPAYVWVAIERIGQI